MPSGENIAYIYDGQNRLVGKQVNGTLTEGFLYDGQLEPVAELGGSGNVVEQFVYGTRPNVPDYIIKGGVEYKVIADQVGSPVLIVIASTGAIAEQISYDAWGNITSDSNPGFQPFGFAGGLYDSDTGLVHFGARDYDPQTGRWVSKDPLLFSGGDSNLYGYALNDPINIIDQDGQFAVALAVILPIVGGVITGGFDAYEAYESFGKCSPVNWWQVAGAFGRGFAGGSLGTLAAIGTLAATKNPLLAGAAGAAVDVGVEDLLGGHVTAQSAALSVAAGAVLGAVAEKVAPLVGRSPSLLLGRTAKNFGKNSQRLLGQQAVESLGSGLLQPGASGSATVCGCSNQ